MREGTRECGGRERQGYTERERERNGGVNRGSHCFTFLTTIAVG